MTPDLFGLRIDADTFRGTRDGVPTLLRILKKHQVTASFFFCLGPDNMGRHLLRFRHPSFLMKMWRSRAIRLYGWDILFRGLLTRGPVMGKALAAVIRETESQGHEVGLHAWDHFGWQDAALTSRASPYIGEDLRRGVDAFEALLGRKPDCSAAPAWLGTVHAITMKAGYPFRYNSDCRGDSIFRPVLVRALELQPQIPTTLPVYDEVIGRDGLKDDDYNRFILTHLRPGRLNVLTIHAEVEGIACVDLFDRFLEELGDRGFGACPLGRLLDQAGVIPSGNIELRSVPGRHGLVAVQASSIKR